MDTVPGCGVITQVEEQMARLVTTRCALPPYTNYDHQHHPQTCEKNRNTVNVTIEPKFTTIPGMYTFTCSLLWHLGTSKIPGLISVITEVFHLGTRGRSGGGVGAVKPSDQI